MSMKATGIVRKVDGLGRIVLPMELRRTLSISEGDPLEIFTSGGGIILRPYRVGCAVCGEMSGVVEEGGTALCPACIIKFATSLREV